MPSAPASPNNYCHYSGRPHYPQQPTGQQYMQTRHLQGMMGPHPGLQGMLGTGPGPQGMPGSSPVPPGMVHMGSSMGAPHQGPLSSPGGHPMPQGLVPLNGSMQASMQYMGYYPAPYFAPQSAGERAPSYYICLCKSITSMHTSHG